jgi:aspartate aminotransferase
MRRRDLICRLLKEIPGLRVTVPQGAFYVMPDMTAFFGKSYNGITVRDSDEMALYLLNEARVALVAGSAFGAPECVRISYATSDEKITEAVARIKEALGKLK